MGEFLRERMEERKALCRNGIDKINRMQKRKSPRQV